MPSLHTRDRDVSDYRDQRQTDREISLGTGTILGIFFALALLCALFFGFGYSMGRKSAQPSVAATIDPGEPPPTGSLGGPKPTAGSASQQLHAPSRSAASGKDSAGRVIVPADPDAQIVSSVNDDSSSTAPIGPARNSPATPSVRPPAKTSSSPSAAPPVSAMPTINANGTNMVQVAAVSHQEDADSLLSALSKRGYTVFIRHEPQDHLLHVQVGPFSSRKDAEAMRQRLLTDGYNAIVK